MAQNSNNIKPETCNLKPKSGTKRLLRRNINMITTHDKRSTVMDREYQTYWRGNWIFTLPFILLLLYLFL